MCYVILSTGDSSSLESVPIAPLLLLNNFPAIQDIVSGFSGEESVAMKFVCDLYDGYKYKPVNSGKPKVGIYKPNDKVYTQAFLFDGKERRRIPDYDESPDAIGFARCFVRICERQKLFIYHSKSKTINVLSYSELPVLITRALVLFAPKQITSQRYNYPLSKDVPYKNIGQEVVDELVRIFGKESMEVKDD